MPHLYELPVEITSLVVNECDKKSLVKLCLTSKSLRLIAQSLLYREVNPRTPAECVMCCKTLLSRPDLAIFTRDFLIMFDPKDCIFPALWAMVVNVLALTRNLASLHFAVQGLSGIIFRNCTLPRLRILSSVLDLSIELRNFLARHPSIKQLCLGGELPNQRLFLPASALPALEIYLGSRSLACDIIPGRPVSQVTLAWMTRMSHEEVIDTIGTLATGTVPMRHFGCTTFSADANHSIMHALAVHMPGLHSLRINTLSSGGVSDGNFVATIPVALQGFKELQRLDLPCLVNLEHNQMTYDVEQEVAEGKIVNKWKACCPSLETVTLPSCMKWHFSHGERIWQCKKDTDDEMGNALF